MILNASAANGSSSSAWRSSVVLELARRIPVIARDVERAGQVVDDRVEQRLHTLVLERGAAEHGHDLAGDGGGADRGAEVVGGDLLLADVLLEHVLVVLAHDVDELVAPARSASACERGGDVDGSS